MYFSHFLPHRHNAVRGSSNCFLPASFLLSMECMQAKLTKLLIPALMMSLVLVIPTQRAHAEAEEFVFEVSAERLTRHLDVMAQAESEAERFISRRFHENSGISSLQVSVLLNRNGEVIPIFVTTVSRQQWNHSTQVSQWTRYHNTYALLKRHDTTQRHSAIAAAPKATAASSVLRPFPGIVAAAPRTHDVAFDRGNLSPQLIQDSLDHWD